MSSDQVLGRVVGVIRIPFGFGFVSALAINEAVQIRRWFLFRLLPGEPGNFELVVKYFLFEAQTTDLITQLSLDKISTGCSNRDSLPLRNGPPSNGRQLSSTCSRTFLRHFADLLQHPQRMKAKDLE